MFRHRGDPVPLDALEHVRGVPTLERLHDSVVHLPRGGTHLIEEPPVVGDDEEPALPRRPPVLHVPGEPGDPFHVEVVRRFIEPEHVPIPGEKRGERDPAALPAR